MKKCVNSRCKFYECTKVCHTCNFSCNYCTYSEIFCCIYPWICLWEFQAERNLCIMNVFYKNFQCISYMEYFLRIVDSSP